MPQVQAHAAEAPDAAAFDEAKGAGGVLSASARALRGETAAQPFVAGQTAGSGHFRIPSILALSNGWLLAGADARWNSYADSPNNLDGLVSISKDGGATWEWQLVNEFVDCASSDAGGGNGQSASFIDPTFIQDSSGTVYMVADAWPAGSGIWGTGGARCDITGFDESGDFMLSKGAAGSIASLEGSEYTYRVDASAAHDFDVEGERARLMPITAADGSQTGMWVDAYYDLYEVRDGLALPSMTVQQGTGEPVQNNVFYSQSEYKAYPTCYLWLVTGQVTDDGIMWSAPTILDVKQPDDQPFTGICPGRGLVVPLEDGGERVMFQVYESKQGGNETASAIWSDDGGKTWQRGARANRFNGAGKSSESQTILLPNGDIRMYSRNSAGFISYCDSTDGGATWGPYALDRELAYTGNCMVSFINVEGALVSPDGAVHENLVAASYPKTTGRQDGVVRIGSIDAETNKVTWLNGDDVRYPGKYLYSCLTQTDEGLALVYENQGAADGSKDVVFERLSVQDMMGAGWVLVEQTPSATLSSRDVRISTGESAQLSLAVQGIEGVFAPADGASENVRVNWSVMSDTPAEVVELDRDQSAPGESVAIRGLASGKATVRARIEVEAGGSTFVLSDSARVYVSGDGQIVLPDEYDMPIEKHASEEYVVQDDEIADGSYLVYGDAAADGAGRILYLHTSATTDRLRSSVENGCIMPDAGGKFPIERQQWRFERTGQGYTIRNGGTGDYLNVAGVHDAGLPFGDVPTYFSIEDAGEGRWRIATQVAGTTYYLGQNAATGNFTAGEQEGPGVMLGRATQAFAVSAEGLAALLADAATLNDSDAYTKASWETFASERERAQRAYDELTGGRLAEDAADAAVAALGERRLSLYEAMQGLVLRSEVEYAVTLKIEGDYFTDDAYEPLRYRMGEKVELPEAREHEGYVFDGWDGLPADGLMPECDLVLTGSYSKAETPDTPVAPEGGKADGSDAGQGGDMPSAVGDAGAEGARAEAGRGSAFARTGDTATGAAQMAGVICAFALACIAAARRAVSRRFS